MTENYPRVLSVIDDRGHAFTAVDGDYSFRPVDTGEELRPGDIVEFRCVGESAQGRRLQWTLEFIGRAAAAPSATGNEVTLTWTVADEHVRDNAAAIIRLSALDTPYHRNGDSDEQIEFYYKVSPPLDS
jgi:hypothetical protein